MLFRIALLLLFVRPSHQLNSGFNLLMDTPVVLKGVTDIVDRYDIFLLDQFGVLHDGVTPLPGVLSTLDLLKEKKKKTVILSNTSSRSSLAKQKYGKMGFPQSDMTFVTSGEFAWNFIEQHYAGKTCTWFTWETHGSDVFLSSLNITPASVETSDFLLFHGTQVVVDAEGSEEKGTSLTLFVNGIIDESIKKIFQVAIARNIPAVCANMDCQAMANQKLSFMPGMLMDEYQKMGGTVHSFGKPLVEYFERAIAAGMTGRWV